MTKSFTTFIYSRLCLYKIISKTSDRKKIHKADISTKTMSIRESSKLSAFSVELCSNDAVKACGCDGRENGAGKVNARGDLMHRISGISKNTARYLQN